MKAARWIGWFLAPCLLCLICAADGVRYGVRRPPPPRIYKKHPMTQRISMGNTIHIGGNFPRKRPPYKPANYRIRRPPMFEGPPPNSWKTQQSQLGAANNHISLPQRPPVKEFHTMNEMPEYSPEYRLESAAVQSNSPHRVSQDEDKGPIHTIPAPNLSPANKPAFETIGNAGLRLPPRGYDSLSLSGTTGRIGANFGFGTMATSVAPLQLPAMVVTSPTPTQHHYEVTESNEIASFFTPRYDVTRFSTVVAPELQTNEVFLGHPSNLQFGYASAPVQTNLHGSLHVGFPGTAPAPAQPSSSVELHVGHPAPAGPPLSAAQLYELFDGSFPQQLTEQYITGQQPQLRQHMLQQQQQQQQQQLQGQLFQQAGVTSFSQPQMHSFNYDEQANKQQQQQILVGQDYASGRVTADYSLEPVSAISGGSPKSSSSLHQDEDDAFVADAPDQSENNIEYEETAAALPIGQEGSNSGIATRFYTTLPSREAAEKLAALAAAGNVNSHLIGKLDKHQEQRSRPSNEHMPRNHKDQEWYQPLGDEAEAENQDDPRQRVKQPHRLHGQYQVQQYEHQQQQSQENADKRPLRIMVPEVQEYVEELDQQPAGENDKFNADEEYEYEDEDEQKSDSSKSPSGEYDSNSEFESSRLNPKSGK